jgi:hypothetical protein
MPSGQSINKTTSIIKQSALGTPGAGAGATVLTRSSAVFSAPSDTFESNVITGHQQSTGIGYGMKKPSGKVESLLSTETWKLLFAGLLRRDFAAGGTTGALTNVTAAVTAGASGTFTRAAGSFLTDGFKIGDVIRWSGWTTGGVANNAHNFIITALTALVMTGTMLDGVAVGAKAAGDSVTGVVQGKKTFAPISAQTNDYFTVEEWHSGLVRSELFTDAKVGSIALGLPATGNSTFGADILALARSRGNTRILTTPTETTFREMVAVNGKLYLAATGITNCTGVQFTLSDSAAHGAPVVGANSAADVVRSTIKLSGQFTAKFDGITIQDIYEAQSAVSLFGVITEDNTPTSAFFAFSMGKIKLTNDAPDDGMEIIRTYPFVSEWNDAGGVALSFDQTIFTCQDSQL